MNNEKKYRTELDKMIIQERFAMLSPKERVE